MKKLFLGAVLGIAAGAVGYKLYKENEEEIKGFLDEHLSDAEDVDVEDIDLEDLEELRDCIDEMIDAKLNSEMCCDDDFCFDDDCYYDEEYFCDDEYDRDYDDDYICIVQDSKEDESEETEDKKEENSEEK